MPVAVSVVLLLAVLVSSGPVHAQDEAPTPTPNSFLEESTQESTPGLPAATPETATPQPSPTETAALPQPTVTPTSIPLEPTATPYFSPDFAPNQVLVKFRRVASTGSIQSALADTDSRILDSIEEIGVQIIEVPPGHVLDTVAALRSRPEVLYAEPNYTVIALDTFPNDPSWSSQYNLRAIRAPQGWDYATGSSAITIAIIDTGVDLTHPDLLGKLVAGRNFVSTDPKTIPADDNGHGTHVAGIAAAASNNKIGIAGVSWGAKIMPVKVLNSAGLGTFANAALGVTWAADNGAQIINLSLGSTNTSLTLQNAIDYAISRGVLVIASAGNSGGQVFFPASYSPVIAVGATDASNARIVLSAHGPQLDLMAPGDKIYSLSLGGSYTERSGTSMASPHVAGLAAILLGIPGNNSPGLVEQQMKSSALDLDSPGWDDYTGFGLIQMDAAIRLANPPIPTPTPTALFTATRAQRTATATSTGLPRIFWAASPTPTATPSPVPTLSPGIVTLAAPTASASPTIPPAVTLTLPPPTVIASALGVAPVSARDDTLLYTSICFLCPGLVLGLYLLIILRSRRQTPKK